MMKSTITTLVNQFHNVSNGTNAIYWAPPIPAFGDPSRAHVATIGLNPSVREFVDMRGKELIGIQRRFPTLYSLGLNNWEEANDVHLEEIADACRQYFQRNPYDGWFSRLEFLIQETNMSFYCNKNHATHLDLVPYTTAEKWADLSQKDKRILIEASRKVFGMLLRETPVNLLILNGMSVIRTFQTLSDVKLRREEEPKWLLPRKTGTGG